MVWGCTWPPYFLAIENMPPHFSVQVDYSQMAGWIRMIPHGTEVCLGPGDVLAQYTVVLDWELAPSSSSTQRGTAVPHVSAHAVARKPGNPYCRLYRH